MDSGIVRHRASGNIDIGLLKRSAHWVYGRLLGRTVFLERTAVRLGVDCAAKFVHHPRAYDVQRSGDNLLPIHHQGPVYYESRREHGKALCLVCDADLFMVLITLGVASFETWVTPAMMRWVTPMLL